MTVSTTHTQYSRYALAWQRCRDVIAGRDALVRQARSRYYQSTIDGRPQLYEQYIRPLSGQTSDEYLSYVERAAFYGATGRTVEALTGLIFGKDPSYELPSAIEGYVEDITLSACNLREFVSLVVTEEISVTRVGVLVDYPATSPQGLSRAQAEALNLRPFLKMYRGESIINWRTTTVNGAQVLTLVVLAEEVEKQTGEFTTDIETQYRVLDLTPEGYRQRVLDRSGQLIGDELYPRMRGEPMRFIPFSVVGGFDVRRPLLLDLVDTNIAHYRNSADYEHGLHFVGLPTPYVAGVQLQEGQTLTIGSSSAWVFPDPAASAAFLEFKGDGLKTLADAMTAKEQRMAVLGARMLADEKRSSEAQGTVEMRTAGERSLLAAAARDVSFTIRRCLNWMAEWVGAPADVQFSLNTDYGAHRLDPTMLRELVSAYQGGAIPLSTLFDNLQRGEIVQPDETFESFQAQIADAAPSLTTPVPVNGA